MSQMLQDAQRIVAQFNKRRSRGGLRYPQMQAGKNVYRLFPFRHIVNAWDVALGRYPEEKLGQEVDVLAVPVIRYYLGGDESTGKGGRLVNGLEHSWRCPLYKDYYSKDQKDRNRRERPSDLYAVNALDMSRVGDGIQPILFKDSEWLGQKVSDGSRVTYGIFNLLVGWPTEGGGDGDDGDEDTEGPGSGVLKPFAGYGEAILGARGQDIVLVKRLGKVGRNDALLLDKSAKGGPVKVRSKKSSVEIPEKLLASIQDLLILPETVPGWASDGHHLPHPETPDLVSQFIVALKAVPTAGKLATPVAGGAPPEEEVDDDDLIPGEDTLEEAQEAPQEALVGMALEEDEEEITPGSEAPAAEEPKEEKKKPRRKSGLAPGDPVEAKDVEEENGVEVTTTLRGKVHQVVGGTVEVVLAPDDQPDERAKDMVTRAVQSQKTNVFKFPREAVSLIEG